MSYPPQQPGPYGPQPDPYGQQQGQQPWTGGFEQQPQQQGYPGGYQGNYPGYPGGPPQQPKKTGLIVGLVVGAVLLVGGGITTVLLLNKDDDSSTVAGTSDTNTPGGNATAEDVVKAVIAAVDAKNSQAAIETLCDKDSAAKRRAFDLDRIDKQVTLKGRTSGKITERDGKANATLIIDATEPGESPAKLTMNLTLKQQDSGWCVDTVAGRDTSTTARPSTTRRSS